MSGRRGERASADAGSEGARANGIESCESLLTKYFVELRSYFVGLLLANDGHLLDRTEQARRSAMYTMGLAVRLACGRRDTPRGRAAAPSSALGWLSGYLNFYP